MLSSKKVLSDSLSIMNTIKDLTNCIIENDLASSFKGVLTACIIFISLSVTVASQAFSQLKIIKNYLKNSMGEERL